MIKGNFEGFVSSDISEFIQRSNYELSILELLNKSKIVFPGEFEHIDSQSNGECDFIRKDNSEKFDVKLLLLEKQGENLGSNHKDISSFYNTVAIAVNEISDILTKKSTKSFDKTIIGKAVLRLISKVKQDENLIVFIPFPILGLPSGSIFEACLYNSINYIFEMSEKAIANIKNLYIIYMTSDNKLALRNKNQCELEFFDCDSITKFLRNDLKRIEHF